ncbi:MAG: hypothetical protein PHC83_03530 [Bacteroidales bacterium]|nr:hypothetical protein [Bacteroidales bacterium]MDD4210037.1 hypothetical protein [Bacteroidales bacterium]
MLKKKLIGILLFYMFFCFIACNKPEDKIRGQWQMSKIYKNNIETISETPTDVESLLSTWTFYHSSILVISYYNNKILYETSGNWSIIENDDFLEVSFNDKYSNIERQYRIEKFKTNELTISFVDKEENKWTLVFSLQFSFQDYDI